MNPKTGEIVSGISEELARELGLVPMKTGPTEIQMRRRPPRIGKYDPCPCGSGKKFKFCCYQRS